jgi:hypothetical protein
MSLNIRIRSPVWNCCFTLTFMRFLRIFSWGRKLFADEARTNRPLDFSQSEKKAEPCTLLQVGAGVCDLCEESAEEQTEGLQAEAGKRGQPRGPEITGESLASPVRYPVPLVIMIRIYCIVLHEYIRSKKNSLLK